MLEGGLPATRNGDPSDVPALAAEQIRQHEARIAVYEGMVERFGAKPRAQPRMITLEFGLEREHAALRFWRALAGAGWTDCGTAARTTGRVVDGVHGISCA